MTPFPACYVVVPVRDDVRYIESKSSYGHRGPAWIARVSYSRSRRTLYFDGHALRRSRGGGIRGNFHDTRTGREYWVSGVKRNGEDRHRFGGGPIQVEATLVPELLVWTGREQLDPKRYVVIDDLVPTDPAEFVDEENAPLAEPDPDGPAAEPPS